MKRVLFDPGALNKIANRAPGGAIGVGASPVDWVLSASRQRGSLSFSDPDRMAREEAKNDLVLIQGARGGHRAEVPDPPPSAPGPGLVLQTTSGESFKDRLLARARWPESRNVEDRRGLGPQKSDMTIDEWVDKHSEWRKK